MLHFSRKSLRKPFVGGVFLLRGVPQFKPSQKSLDEASSKGCGHNSRPAWPSHTVPKPGHFLSLHREKHRSDDFSLGARRVSFTQTGSSLLPEGAGQAVGTHTSSCPRPARLLLSFAAAPCAARTPRIEQAAGTPKKRKKLIPSAGLGGAGPLSPARCLQQNPLPRFPTSFSLSDQLWDVRGTSGRSPREFRVQCGSRKYKRSLYWATDITPALCWALH